MNSLRIVRAASRAHPSAIRTNLQRRGYADAVSDKIKLTLALPHQSIYKSTDVVQVNIPAESGEMGVLANHVPSIEQLKPGLVEIIEESGGSKQFFLSGGFAIVQPNSQLSINAVEGFPLEDFSAEAVRSQISEAQKIASGSGSEQDIAEAKIELENTMTESNTPKSLGRSIVRYHSPYCEATGPIVEEGTVAARIRALQCAARDNLDIIRSHTPVTPTPPCRLISDWRPHSALGSRSPDRQSSPNSHTQLADYILNESPQHSEVIVPCMVRNKSPAFGASALRRKSTAVLGHPSKMLPDSGSPESPAIQSPLAVPLPSLSRETSWKHTIKQNAAARSGKSLGDKTGSPGSTPLRLLTATGLGDETWPNSKPLLRKVSTDHTPDAAKPVRQHMSIAEEIGEMINRALQGRDDPSGTMSPQSSIPEFSKNAGEVHGGKLNRGDLAQYEKQHAELQARISPVLKQAEDEQDPFTSHVPKTGSLESKVRPYHSRRYDGRYSSVDDNHPWRDGSGTETYFVSNPTLEQQSITPTHHSRPRACTYTNGRPLPCNDKNHTYNPVTRRSVSNPMTSSQERFLCSNDRYEVFFREMHEHHSKSSRQKHSTVPKDKTRRPSVRNYAATAPRPPPKRSYNQSQGQGSTHKRWKWWKLVMVDKEPLHAELSESEPEPREKISWGPATHPLAGHEHHDEGYEANNLVERLEKACAKQKFTELEQSCFAGAAKSSGHTTHTLAQCGHEDDEDLEPLELSGDGSWDVFRSTTTSASGTITHRSATKPQLRVKITSKGCGTRVEVKTGKQQGRERSGAMKSVRNMKVLVMVHEGKDSVIKVEIGPTRK
ncbi:delta subunit of the central stalk of mitochondrial F1F0 ATP synthase, atp16 [Xylographa trunciseda]|nr:delta subunit of the central stalk of mitochondrial F1F0 ATP synthase, atp16 [Xylographa trunciseda]